MSGARRTASSFWSSRTSRKSCSDTTPYARRRLAQGDVPAAARKHVPRYPLVSATLVGRLAVSEARQGERLGAMLLADAVRRAYASAATVGSSMLVVDAISERAAAFYEGNGFVRLPDSLRLVLPMHAIQRLVEP